MTGSQKLKNDASGITVICGRLRASALGFVECAHDKDFARFPRPGF